MRKFARAVFLVLLAVSFQLSSTSNADAKCTRLAFSVNDYGKIEPAADAKKLLDGYIVKWTGERGITGYKVGTKSIDCKLFLDFVVFDEYTCRAEASVCWGDTSAKPKLRQAQAAEPAVVNDKPAKVAQSNTAPQIKPGRKPATRPQGGYNSVYEAN